MWVKKLSDCEEFTAGDGCALREYLHPARGDFALRYSLAHATVPARRTTRAHTLKTSEVYVILSGRGIMHIDDDSRRVKAEDVIYIPPGSVQYIENISKGNLRFLCIVDPAWRKEDETIL